MREPCLDHRERAALKLLHQAACYFQCSEHPVHIGGIDMQRLSEASKASINPGLPSVESLRIHETSEFGMAKSTTSSGEHDVSAVRLVDQFPQTATGEECCVERQYPRRRRPGETPLPIAFVSKRQQRRLNFPRCSLGLLGGWSWWSEMVLCSNLCT